MASLASASERQQDKQFMFLSLRKREIPRKASRIMIEAEHGPLLAQPNPKFTHRPINNMTCFRLFVRGTLCMPLFFILIV